MTRRLNISIPDDLAEQVEMWRERAGLNVSRISAAALQHEVERLEAEAARIQEEEGRRQALQAVMTAPPEVITEAIRTGYIAIPPSIEAYLNNLSPREAEGYRVGFLGGTVSALERYREAGRPVKPLRYEE